MYQRWIQVLAAAAVAVAEVLLVALVHPSDKHRVHSPPETHHRPLVDKLLLRSWILPSSTRGYDHHN